MAESKRLYRLLLLFIVPRNYIAMFYNFMGKVEQWVILYVRIYVFSIYVQSIIKLYYIIEKFNKTYRTLIVISNCLKC